MDFFEVKKENKQIGQAYILVKASERGISMVNWIELIKEDVNQEDGVIISFFSNITSFLFKGVILFAVPIFLYFLTNLF